jgi:Mrp family chromosome partitioning ATPase
VPTPYVTGAKVAIFDADVYGPSLPTMTSPEIAVLQMDKETGEDTGMILFTLLCSWS